MSGGTGKSSLRKSSLEAMRSLDPAALRALSESVADNLYTLGEFKSSGVLVSYVAKADEVQTESIIRRAIKAGKRVIVPVTEPSRPQLSFSELRDYGELSPGRFRIPEPRRERVRLVSLGEADVALVPLVAWDERGYRLGYGKGYFDRALAEFEGQITTIGLGLESQRLPKVPEEAHDYALDIVVTEKRVVRCAGARRRHAA